ncbi:MAG TPA: hypothetical protein VFB50_11540, partial [Chloroflexota bacterium]|nr:hypothetical protein [Chloroflexota bacterium]
MRTRVPLIATYRDVELGRDHPLQTTLAETARAGSSQALRLRGLERRGVSLAGLLSSKAQSSGALRSSQRTCCCAACLP